MWLIARRGEVHLDTIGRISLEGGAGVSPDTIFRISSMTKPVTGVATMILLEDCVLRLDDPVDGWLPELADRQVVRRIDGPVDDTVPASRPITVRDLLTFRMGFGRHFGTSPANDAAALLQLSVGPPQPALSPEPDEWMRRFSTLPLMCQPGERWLCHTGADVLGVLIARASGQPLENFLRERIFEPLGMQQTAFCVGAADLNRLSTCYAAEPGTGQLRVYDEPQGQWAMPPAFPSGGAGLVSTAQDFLAFAEMLLRGGSPILSRPSVETMTSDHLTPGQKAVSGFFPGEFDARGWGFCVGVVTRRDHPAMPVGQYGWDGGLGTIWRNDPSEQMITILLTNAMWTISPPSGRGPRLSDRGICRHRGLRSGPFGVGGQGAGDGPSRPQPSSRRAGPRAPSAFPGVATAVNCRRGSRACRLSMRLTSCSWGPLTRWPPPAPSRRPGKCPTPVLPSHYGRQEKAFCLHPA